MLNPWYNRNMRRFCHSLLCLLIAASGAACSRSATAPDFTLRDDGGSAWTLSQQHGKTVVLTFGFTHCADTCPATVAKLVRLAASSGAPQSVEIALVTVDPHRDSAQAMHRFVGRFSTPREPNVVGLTGSPQQIARVKAQYHIWSARLPHGDIAHTAAIFFIDPAGRIAAVRDDADGDAALAHALATTVAS
jgi:protein SCO1